MQPQHNILKEGPVVGTIQKIVLRCPADAWPLPKYQWYRNGILIPHCNGSELKLYVYAYMRLCVFVNIFMNLKKFVVCQYV